MKTFISAFVLAMFLGATALSTAAQQSGAGAAAGGAGTATGGQVVQITGLVGVKANTKGSLTPANGSLDFVHSKTKVSVPINSVEDVTTGNDSQRVFRGTVGTLTMFAPYGGGRFLSLFRSKLDTLTIKYRDAEGGLHGAIFAMPVGQAELLKKELISKGAHTSIPDSATASAQPDALKEKKP